MVRTTFHPSSLEGMDYITAGAAATSGSVSCTWLNYFAIVNKPRHPCYVDANVS
jgi:hypothetical protein